MVQATPLAERDLSWHRAQSRRLAPVALEQQIEKRLRKEDYRGAVIYLESLVTCDPSSANVLRLARMLRRCRDDHGALRCLAPALARWPQDLELRRCQAEAAMAVEDFAQGLQAWEVLSAAPRQPDAYIVLRMLACLRLTGQEARAKALVAAHASRFPRGALRLLRSGRHALPEVAPGLYLVAGNNGTGKSTLGHFLQALGYPIIDADRDIASFCVEGVFSDLRHDLMRQHPGAVPHWVWPEQRMAARFADFVAERDIAFLIGGCGATVMPHLSRFRKVLHLSAPDHVIAARLEKRNSPSHAPGSRGFIAALKRNRREAEPAYPATIIAADRPTWMICADCIQAVAPSRAPAPLVAGSMLA